MYVNCCKYNTYRHLFSSIYLNVPKGVVIIVSISIPRSNYIQLSVTHTAGCGYYRIVYN